MNPAVLMNEALFVTLNDWVDRYYRDRLACGSGGSTAAETKVAGARSG